MFKKIIISTLLATFSLSAIKINQELFIQTVKCRSLKNVKKLIDQGVEINAKTKFGDTPLHTAIKWWKKKHILPLLENGADKNIKNNENRRAEDEAKDLAIKELINNYMAIAQR